MKERAVLFSALAEPLRLRCLALMAVRGEVCVCQLTHALEVSQPSVSKHLAVLREAGLVEQRRAAQWILYRIADLPDWACTVMDGALEGLGVDPRHRSDLRRMKSAPDGPPDMVLPTRIRVRESRV